MNSPMRDVSEGTTDERADEGEHERGLLADPVDHHRSGQRQYHAHDVERGDDPAHGIRIHTERLHDDRSQDGYLEHVERHAYPRQPDDDRDHPSIGGRRASRPFHHDMPGAAGGWGAPGAFGAPGATGADGGLMSEDPSKSSDVAPQKGHSFGTIPRTAFISLPHDGHVTDIFASAGLKHI